MADEGRRFRWIAALVALCCSDVQVASAAEAIAPPAHELTLGAALEMARSRTPAVLAAQSRIEAARGELAYAERGLPSNPTVELGAGPRFGEDDTTLDLDVGLSQQLTLGGARTARVDAAQAGVDLATASAADAARRALLDVARAFLAVGRADGQLAVARDAERFAGEVARIAERRHEAGEAGVLDVHLASLAVARAQTHRQGLRAGRAHAEADLREILALEPDARIVVRTAGAPSDRGAPEAVDLDVLLGEVDALPHLRELDAALRQAEAEVRRGEAGVWPDFGVRVGYGREEGSDIVTGGFFLGLPVVDHGQGIEGPARARARALRTEQRAAVQAARSRIRAAFEAHENLAAADEHFEREGLPRIDQGEDLARRSYEAGVLPLADLLAVRRELVDARQDHVNLRFEAALARVELDAAAGVLR